MRAAHACHAAWPHLTVISNTPVDHLDLAGAHLDALILRNTPGLDQPTLAPATIRSLRTIGAPTTPAPVPDPSAADPNLPAQPSAPPPQPPATAAAADPASSAHLGAMACYLQARRSATVDEALAAVFRPEPDAGPQQPAHDFLSAAEAVATLLAANPQLEPTTPLLADAPALYAALPPTQRWITHQQVTAALARHAGYPPPSPGRPFDFDPNLPIQPAIWHEFTDIAAQARTDQERARIDTSRLPDHELTGRTFPPDLDLSHLRFHGRNLANTTILGRMEHTAFTACRFTGATIAPSQPSPHTTFTLSAFDHATIRPDQLKEPVFVTCDLRTLAATAPLDQATFQHMDPDVFDVAAAQRDHPGCGGSVISREPEHEHAAWLAEHVDAYLRLRDPRDVSGSIARFLDQQPDLASKPPDTIRRAVALAESTACILKLQQPAQPSPIPITAAILGTVRKHHQELSPAATAAYAAYIDTRIDDARQRHHHTAPQPQPSQPLRSPAPAPQTAAAAPRAARARTQQRRPTRQEPHAAPPTQHGHGH